MFSTITLFYSPICKSKIQVATTTKLWVAGGQGTNTLAYSNNGTTWTGLGTSIFSTSGRIIGWNGSMWVAGGSGTAHTLAYSTNGTTWTGLGKTICNNGCYGIAWNGLMWVAVGEGTVYTIAYSTNGTTWTGVLNSTSIFSIVGRGIAWNGLRWVAAGQGTNSLAYSTNGTSWNGLGLSIFSNGGYAVASNTYKILPITLAL